LLERYISDINKHSDSVLGNLAWVHCIHKPHKNPETKSLGNEGEANLIATCCAQLLYVLDTCSSSLHLQTNSSSKPVELTHSIVDSHENNLGTMDQIKIVILTGYAEQKLVLERILAKIASKYSSKVRFKKSLSVLKTNKNK
jgi:hypothetical protein